MNQGRTPTRLWRFAAFSVGGVVLLVACAYAAVVIAFPPARLAQLLAEQVKAATGRNFAIGGDLSMHLLPTISVRANDIVLGNVAWGSRPDMVRVRHAAFEVALTGLLQGQLKILRVEVEGVDALLESDNTGRSNWEFKPEKASAATTAASGSVTDHAQKLELDRLVADDVHVAYLSTNDSPPRSLNLETLVIQGIGSEDEVDASLLVEQQRWKIQGRTGRASVLLEGAQDWPFDFRLSTEGAKVSVSGMLGTGARAGTLAAALMANFDTAAALMPLGSVAKHIPLPVTLNAKLTFAGHTARVDPIRVSAAGQAVDGQVALNVNGPMIELDAKLAAGTIDVVRLLPIQDGSPNGAIGAAPSHKVLLNDEPLPFNAIPPMVLDIDVSIGRIEFKGLPSFSKVHARLTSTPSRVSIDPLRFGFANGDFNGRAVLLLAPNSQPRLEVMADAKSISVDALDAALTGQQHLKGGKANLRATLTATGSTTKRIVASSDGNVLLSVKDVALASSVAASNPNAFMSVLGALVPRGAVDRALTLQCAVVRLPLKEGVVKIDRSVAFETSDISMVATGDVDLISQTLNMSFVPKVKRGLAMNPANLAGLVSLQGPLLNPRVGIDAKGALRQATVIGAAVATGGLTLLVPLFRGGAQDASACDHAERLTAAAVPASGAAPVQPATPEGRLRRLFGSRKG